MKHQELFMSLLDKYISGTITPMENNELFQFISSGEFDHLLDQHLLSQFDKENIKGTDISPYRAQEIMLNILEAESHTAQVLPAIKRQSKIIWWGVAASVIGLLIVMGYFWGNEINDNKNIAGTKYSDNDMSEKINSSSWPLKLKMDDGSMVTLQPDSKLRFPNHFLNDKREVYLEGEAFFEVSKKPGQPFFVYYNNLVTHVLGTSFNVKIDKIKKEVEVLVVSGKVQVYENKNPSVSDKNNKPNGIILTPNQKVTYREDDRQFTATLVNQPVPVFPEAARPDILPERFIFRETALSEVLKLLETSYGIEMITENDKLYTCLFTGNISKYDLYTKLDIICQSVNAAYEINGTKILIRGKGCN